MEEVDVLFRSATCITMVDSRPFCRGQVAIKDGKIYAMGSDLRYDAKEVFDEDLILLPGLVDAHTHAFQILLRGIVDNVYNVHPLWLRLLIPFEMSLTEKEAALSAKLTVLNMIKNGVVMFLDAGGPRPDLLAEAALSAGIKGAVTYSTSDKVEGYVHDEKDGVRLAERYRGRVRGWLSIRQIMISSERLIRAVFEASREKGIPVTMHISEEHSEIEHAMERWGVRPVEYLKIMKYLTRDLVLAHAAFLSDSEVDHIASGGSSVVHCPAVNYAYMNFAKIPQMIRRGINVAIGSDGGANSSLDLLAELRAAYSALNGYHATPYHYYSEVGLYDLMKMATVNGFRALREEGSGRIAVGYNADIIAIRPGPSVLPLHDPVSLPFYASGRDVAHVLVDGRVIMKDREVLTMNEREILKEVMGVEDEVERKVRELVSKARSGAQTLNA
ncbi:MAG: amidohydrolase family protein [Nitrososphaeria archaeon]